MKRFLHSTALGAFVAAALIVSLPFDAEAQTPENVLRGLSQMQLLIENLDNDSTTCGVTKELIQSAVRYPVSSANFQLNDAYNSTLDSTFYVSVSSIDLSPANTCVSHINIKIYSSQSVTLDYSHRRVLSASIDLWDRGSMVWSARAEHAHNVAESIEILAKKFITDWNFDNQDEKARRPTDRPGTPEQPQTQSAPWRVVSQTPAPLRSTPAVGQPEVVQVKYRGPVSLAPFACESITRSSFIERVCYDAKNTYMLIELNGAWYHYCEIDQGAVSSLLAADSMGHFFDTSIKGNFDCRTHRVPVYGAAHLPQQGDLAPTVSLARQEPSQTLNEPSAASGGQGIAAELASNCASGMPDEKIAACSEAIRQNAKASWAYVNRGDAYLNKSDYDNAIADGTSAIEIDPNYAAAYELRGFAYLNKSDYDKAIADETKAIGFDSKDAAAYAFRGLAYVTKGDYNKAIADDTKAIEIDPKQASAYLGRGLAYTAKGEYEKAIADETKSIEIEPRTAENAKEVINEVFAAQKEKSEK